MYTLANKKKPKSEVQFLGDFRYCSFSSINPPNPVNSYFSKREDMSVVERENTNCDNRKQGKEHFIWCAVHT